MLMNPGGYLRGALCKAFDQRCWPDSERREYGTVLEVGKVVDQAENLANVEEAIMKMQYIACIKRFNRTLRPLNATQNV